MLLVSAVALLQWRATPLQHVVARPHVSRIVMQDPGADDTPSPWLGAARAKYVSIRSQRDVVGPFAGVIKQDAVPDVAQWPTYKQLTLEGTASVWTALDNHYEPDIVQGFTDEAYSLMRDDESRTPPFAAAIAARLAEFPAKTLTVLDIGTGPFAVLSLLAAESGARKVYAIEVNPDAARRARETIAAAGWSDVIEVYEGFSTVVELPEKVDLVVSEIVGSIASEEGLHATIQDAHVRAEASLTLTLTLTLASATLASQLRRASETRACSSLVRLVTRRSVSSRSR